MNKEVDAKLMLSNAKFFESYSRWDDENDTYENWEDSVSRVMDMHREKYADIMTNELTALINEAESAYKLKYILGSQRALQFGGEQLMKHNMKMYNCLSSYADRSAYFGEFFYILLAGCGAGVSVQNHHVNKLPKIQERKGQAKIHVVEDSIEGWATASDVLMSSFFVDNTVHEEYCGRKVYFDLTKIREKGKMISGGFKAPGPDPLRKALDKMEYLLQGLVIDAKEPVKLEPIHVYDISMYIADSVISGGVRRSASIFVFSPEDKKMMSSKVGNWMQENPQRARSNNSVLIVRDEITRDEFHSYFTNVKEFGEPGFVFVNSKEHLMNPCVEIGMFPQIKGKSGWQGCNLVEINGSKCTSLEELNKACRAAAIMGTLQAGYTDFKFVTNTTKQIFEREALLGVSITGWMNSPDVLFDAEIQKAGAKTVLKMNKKMAKILGINPAARATTVKPSGNASVLLLTTSALNAEHSPRYFRHVQMPKNAEVASLIRKHNPYMVEDSIWNANGTDYCLSFPVVAQEGSLYRDEMSGVNMLEKVKLVQENWIEYGTDEKLNADKGLRHNVSNTITVKPDDWDTVEEYIFENRFSFCGISLFSESGDKSYFQSPFTSVLSETEILEKYGTASFFASGLIVDTFKGFDNLWDATYIASNNGEYGGEQTDTRSDWIRRFDKFSENYFNGNSETAGDCLKDVFLLHKWSKIQQKFTPIEFETQLETKKFIDIDTMGSIACIGGACEI